MEIGMAWSSSVVADVDAARILAGGAKRVKTPTELTQAGVKRNLYLAVARCSVLLGASKFDHPVLHRSPSPVPSHHNRNRRRRRHCHSGDVDDSCGLD